MLLTLDSVQASLTRNLYALSAAQLLGRILVYDRTHKMPMYAMLILYRQ
jgi:hypothetical protein